MSEQEKNCRICSSNTAIPSSEYTGSCFKLNTFDWLGDLPSTSLSGNLVEIRFKNTRKGFYQNVNSIRLQRGDIVAVEASPGHDIGIVSLTGDIVLIQMKKSKVSSGDDDFKKIYRKAKQVDIEKWEEAIGLEDSSMLKARKIADDLKLDMKIGDVEYQGDKTKAIFYYIADERVDFRELIKILAEEFKVRIEMRQIGARQEAGRIGGIGPCGRELCCTTWITNFVSVTTSAARYQELSPNPQKLAGQCGKLKCCLNYELDCYIDAQKDYPDKSIPLETKDGLVYHQKTDIFRRIMWYSFDRESTVNLTPVPVERVTQIQNFNKKGLKVSSLIDKQMLAGEQPPDFEDVVGQESVTRFQEKYKKTKKRKKKRNK
jgi:cell fate regulator YaaT (PSP1 superfamily)